MNICGCKHCEKERMDGTPNTLFTFRAITCVIDESGLEESAFSNLNSFSKICDSFGVGTLDGPRRILLTEKAWYKLEEFLPHYHVNHERLNNESRTN